MQKLALRTAGIVFAILAGMHVARLTLDLPATLGSLNIPVWMSAPAAVATFALAVWMFRAASSEGK
ncbi:MAG: hypothetical protein HGA80_05580 [Candidatus Omnitrophica bacterium]|nr:hypothetical protein [Candidatus Omnitrophota bacterium]